MLYDVMMNKEKILKHLDLPTYRIPWIREPQLKQNNQTIPPAISVHPQISFFQISLLEFAPVVIKYLSKEKLLLTEKLDINDESASVDLDGNSKVKVSAGLDLLRQMRPLINNYFLPSIQEEFVQ